jgi:hypothetical protein
VAFTALAPIAMLALGLQLRKRVRSAHATPHRPAGAGT